MAKVSRRLLLFILVFVVIHFLKDITQDILKIPTVLDLFGNVNEDLSGFPTAVQMTFNGIGYLSFLIEVFLIVTIPLVLKENRHPKLEKTIWVIITLLVFYFITASLLDPRYSFWR